MCVCARVYVCFACIGCDAIYTMYYQYLSFVIYIFFLDSVSPSKFNTFINISTMIYTILMLVSNRVHVHIKKKD